MNDEMEMQIINILKTKLDINCEDLSKDTALSDLNIESLLFIEIIVTLETEFKIELDDSDLDFASYETINDLIRVVLIHKDQSGGFNV